MAWRPKNWVNPFEKMIKEENRIWDDDLRCYGHPDLIEHLEERAVTFEAGADAMLDDLFEMAKESPTGTFTMDSNKVIIH